MGVLGEQHLLPIIAPSLSGLLISTLSCQGSLTLPPWNRRCFPLKGLCKCPESQLDLLGPDSVQFSSVSLVAQSCLTLCGPMDCSMPGFPVYHQLPEFTQTQVCWVKLDGISHPTISSSVIPFSSCLQSFLVSRSFPVSQFFPSGGQSIGLTASASVLPMNIQGWFSIDWLNRLAV